MIQIETSIVYYQRSIYESLYYVHLAYTYTNLTAKCDSLSNALEPQFAIRYLKYQELLGFASMLLTSTFCQTYEHD